MATDAWIDLPQPSASALPTGAATASNQLVEIAELVTIAANQTNGTQVTVVSNFPAIQPVSGTIAVTQSTNPWIVSGTVTANAGTGTFAISASSLPLPTGAATNSQLITINSTLGSPFQAGGSIGNTTFASTQSGTWNINNISGTISLPTGASTSALQSSVQGTVAPGAAATNSQLMGMVYNSTTPAPTNGQQLALQSDQYANLDAVQPALYVVGQATQTTIVNNILTSTSGTAAIDLDNYNAALVQVISTGTGGSFIFEGSNDNVNFDAVTVYNQATQVGAIINSAITATASTIGYIFPLLFRYYRLRIVTTITGGSIQAFSKFSQATWISPVLDVSVVAGAITTVSAVNSSATAVPLIEADVASAAIITTTTTATLTPTGGVSYKVNIPVTAVSGTTPTLDVEVQESADSGTNWYAVYDFPRITTTGSYNSPDILLTGNRVRYVQTIGGSSPSFTRAINRLQSNAQVPLYHQIIDRTITLTSLGSSTVSLVSDGCKNVQLTFDIGATTLAPILQIQGSDDAGSTWYNIGSTLTSVASSTVSLTVPNICAQFLRATVSTAGTGTTPNYVLLRAW